MWQFLLSWCQVKALKGDVKQTLKVCSASVVRTRPSCALLQVAAWGGNRVLSSERKILNWVLVLMPIEDCVCHVTNDDVVIRIR